MKTKSTRAAIDLAVIAVIGLLTTGTIFGYKIIQPGRNKKVANQIAVATEQANKQAEAAKDDATKARQQVDLIAAQLKDLQALIASTNERNAKLNQQVAGFVGGAHLALKLDPNPTPAEEAAIRLLESCQQVVGSMTPEQQEQMFALVKGLIQKNLDAQKQLDKLTQDALALKADKERAEQAVVAKEKELASTAQSLKETTGKLDAETGKVVVLTEKAEQKAKENQEWANNAQTLWGRIKALSGLIVVVLILAGLAGFKWWKYLNLSKDTISLVEWLKSKAIAQGVDAAKLKQEMHDWYEGDEDAKKAVQKIKTDLRL